MPDIVSGHQRVATASDFFTAYFQAMEESGVPCVILHGYAGYPEHIGSDVDYAVRHQDLETAKNILFQTCARLHWAVGQIFHHTVHGFYFVAFNRNSPGHTIKLDVCSHYGCGFHLFLKDKDLLSGRQRFNQFFIPAPCAEFAYTVAKAAAKQKPLEDVVDRLVALYQQDPAGCSRSLALLAGLSPGDAGHAFNKLDSSSWRQLKQNVMRQCRMAPAFLCREACRRLVRFLRPSGLVVGILGTDGSGKSALCENLYPLVKPLFRRRHDLHFQPALLRRRLPGTVANPHGRLPRGRFASWLKVAYYYADWLVGYWLKLRLMKVRSTLILCDRTFDDLLVDPARYRLAASEPLVRILRRLLPTPDMFVILVAPPEDIHNRKPELPISEIGRQQRLLNDLARHDGRMIIIDASPPQEEVCVTAARVVADFMASRVSKAWTGK